MYHLGWITEKVFRQKLDKLSAGKYYCAEMQECADDYAKLIAHKYRTAKEACADSLIELEAESLDFSAWAPEGFGTADCIIISDNYLEVIDFKYGKGNRVEALGNPQMKLYALGALTRYGALYDIAHIRMTIYQPRLPGVQSEDEIGVVELIEWAKTFVKSRAELAYAGEGDFAPSEDACKFCKAKEQCRARAEQLLGTFDENPDTSLLTPEEAGAILERAADIRAWLTDLENLVTKTLFAGEDVDGWKLVEGRSNRKYVDELQVAQAMTDAGYAETLLYERKLIPLTQMEKDFGKKVVASTLGDLVVKPAGKPTLAPSKDKRPAIQLDEQILAAFDAGGTDE